MNIFGVSRDSIWANSPNINQVKPQVKDIPRKLDLVKVSSADLSDITYKSLIPEYSINSLAPQIPVLNSKFTYHPPVAQPVSSAQPSLTAVLMNKAQAIKAYGG